MIDPFESAYTTIDAVGKYHIESSLLDVTLCHILYCDKTNTLGIVYDTAPSVDRELL